MLAAGVLLVLAACGGDSDAAIAGGNATSPRSEPTETLLRIAADGGEPLAYRADNLAELDWEGAPRLPAVEQVVGAGADERIVYVLDRRRGLIGLDLESGRFREIVGGIRAATPAPDGGVVAVDTGGTALRIRRRTPQALRGSLEGEPGALFPTQRGGVIAAGGRGLAVLGADHPPVQIGFPDGPAAATMWGELVAAATDSGLVFFDPRDGDSTRFVATERPVHAVGFSPSGHRVYAATPDAELLVLDRFGEAVLERIELPGAAGALRVDRYGRWLLARPVVGDSLWVVDLVADSLVGSARGAWNADLPAVTGGRLIVRQGDDVVSLDLRAVGLPRRGVVQDGGADRWTLIQWTPGGEPPAPVLAGDDAPSDDPRDTGANADSLDGGGSGAPVYLQVSSSRNPDWASDLVQQMRSAGLPATLLDPTAEGEPYRVVLGPYRSRDEADEAGRKLGRAYFIIGGDNPVPPEAP